MKIKDITLLLPEDTKLLEDQRHFLLYIPWEEKYLQFVPDEFKEFFMHVLPHLGVRTTDVHTAICLGMIDELLAQFPHAVVNRRVVALALILHDAGWSRLTEQEVAQSLGVTGLKLTEQALAPKEKHAIESEKIAREVLKAFAFKPPLSPEEIELICQAVRFHDKPEAVAGAGEPMPLEVQLLVDLDHLWSFTHENFWQDTLRKGVEPQQYILNLEQDLDSYFVTEPGKEKARELLNQRRLEIE
jgi:hypothetical protein